MKNIYPGYSKLLIAIFSLIIIFNACKKGDNPTPTPAAPTNYATIGLYEYSSSNSRRVFINITKIGTVGSISYPSVFDTGSTGMTMDANGLLPASMITNTGITVPGDSVVVNGITVTSQTAIISYGGVGGITQEYGNLAYAPITIGDANGSVTTTRIPFFLYYKAVDQTTGKSLAVHSNDVFGVGPGTSFTNNKIGSPLSYFPLATNVASGFKLAMFNTNMFSATAPTYVAALLTIGLTPNDINSSGFIMHPLTYYSVGGYSPDITGTVSYNGTSVPATMLFDTGTPATSIIENPSATANVTTLASNSTVSFTTPQGFTYQYTVSSNYNLTQVEKTSYSNDIRTIFSIDFFISNEYLLDYTHHQIGLKNN
jgi:hypothetical protein